MLDFLYEYDSYQIQAFYVDYYSDLIFYISFLDINVPM